MYGIKRERTFADSMLSIAGCRPDDITIVINTHLHFDHAGGNTLPAGTQAPRLHEHEVRKGVRETRSSVPEARTSIMPAFPNARYLVSRSEFQHAESPHERDRASYVAENWHPLIESKQLELMPGTCEPITGLRVEQIRGHSETMQTIKLTSGGETLFGFFDLVPTRHHLPPAWIMSYDLFPTETLEFKKRVLPQALEENWICHFYHDVEAPLNRLIEVNGKIIARPMSDS
jgi:glyoxylase-like metal-dependent hydrolase (beta-lactamase superfamily II)